MLQRDGENPEQFVFKRQYQNRTTAYERMRDSFEALLAETGMAHDRQGNKRVLYSLRHTALMLRVLYGEVPPMLLAANAGTSVDQLERFYCSHLRPRMMVASLQSLKVMPEPLAEVIATSPARAGPIDVRRSLDESATEPV